MHPSYFKRTSYSYRFFHFLLAIAYKYFFYKKVIIKGKENIPKNSALIFAGNHQNALMDALAISFTYNKQTIFLARSDIFKGKVAIFLNWLKVLPIYRKDRDKGNTIAKNEEIFKLSVDILTSKKSMGIFPEGTHYGKRRLHILKKGVPRLAFQAETKNNWDLELYIIPVGLYYDNYFQWKRTLIVEYGKAICIKDYKNQYLENENKAINTLKNDIAKGIKKIILDIENQKFYHLFENIIKIYKHKISKKTIKNKENNHLITAKEINEKLKIALNEKPDNFLILNEKIRKYFKFLNKIGLKNFLFNENKNNFLNLFLQSLIVIILSPFYFYGLINNYLPYKIPWFINKKFKDPLFHTSIMFGLGILLFPLFYTLQTFILYSIINNIFFVMIYAISLPFLGSFAYNYFVFFKNLRLKWKYFFLKKQNNNNFIRTKKLHTEILNILNKTIN